MAASGLAESSDALFTRQLRGDEIPTTRCASERTLVLVLAPSRRRLSVCVSICTVDRFSVTRNYRTIWNRYGAVADFRRHGHILRHVYSILLYAVVKPTELRMNRTD